MSDTIYSAMHQVYTKTGYVQKKGNNKAQNYRYAGEKDLIEALRPAMVEAGIVFFCSGVRDIETREMKGTNKFGEEKTTIHSVGTYEFTFAHAASGSSITVMARGEGTDSLDKASYKAMTGALKYALRQTFVIETGDDPDDDHDAPAPRQAPQRQRDPFQQRQEAQQEAPAKKPTAVLLYVAEGKPKSYPKLSDAITDAATWTWTQKLADLNREAIIDMQHAINRVAAAQPTNEQVLNARTVMNGISRKVDELSRDVTERVLEEA